MLSIIFNRLLSTILEFWYLTFNCWLFGVFVCNNFYTLQIVLKNRINLVLLKSLFLLCLLCFAWVLVCVTGWPGTHCVSQAGFKLTDILSIFASYVLELKACTTMSSCSDSIFKTPVSACNLFCFCFLK